MGKNSGGEAAANTPESGSYSGVLMVQVKLCCLLNNQLSEYFSCYKSASRRRWQWPIDTRTRIFYLAQDKCLQPIHSRH